MDFGMLWIHYMINMFLKSFGTQVRPLGKFGRSIIIQPADTRFL